MTTQSVYSKKNTNTKGDSNTTDDNKTTDDLNTKNNNKTKEPTKRCGQMNIGRNGIYDDVEDTECFKMSGDIVGRECMDREK